MNCHDAVGCVVEVFSDVTKVWCQGRIDEYDPQVGYRVMYDDGNEQWEDLSNPDRVHVVQPSRANMEGYAEGVHVIPTENTIADEKCAMTPPPDLDDVIVDPRVSRESADNDNAIESTTQVYHLQSTKGGQLAPSCRQSSSDVPDDEVEAVTYESENRLIPEWLTPRMNLQTTSFSSGRATTYTTTNNGHEQVQGGNGGLNNTPCSLDSGTNPRALANGSLISSALLEAPTPMVVHTSETTTAHGICSVQTKTQPSDYSGNENSTPVTSKPATAGEFPPVADWDGRTSRLSGRVSHFRSERDMTACHVFVKVHVVSPGPGSVHLRCKRAIHTTQLHVCGGGGAWDDSIWTHTFTGNRNDSIEMCIPHCECIFSIVDDESVDLNTALLYAVYLAQSDNIFLGHVLIPISHFSRGVVVQDEEFALVSRQGKVVAGLFLRLQHQVVLVTTFPTAVPPVKSTPVPDTPKLAKPSKTVDGKPRNLQSTDQKVKPVATRRVHRLVRPKSASGNQKQQALHAKASTIYIAKRRPKPSSNAKLPLPSTYDTQVQLVEDVAALQASVAQAEAQVLRLTAMLSRLDISHGKLKSTAGCLKRSIARTTSSSCSPQGVIPTKPSTPKGPTAAGGGYVETLTLMLAMSALAQDEVATSKSLGDVLDDLQRGRRQLRWLTDPTRKIADDDAFLAQRYTVLMDLKVQVATLHEQESMYQQSAADPIDNVVESKVDARRKKLDQLEQEIAIHRGQYNQMVHDQSSHDLKQKVNDMHLMLLMVSTR
ncbi:hypothetical protein DYB34_011333 [Aphanomyces astaci]|uniref:Uncharacterized protein n=1 Tax=Aphanomyces astaci TaxID=112090 RepID=A0A418BI96_APHAT|nr:hypothetical protein DYB34_011333 [Aphanomyces astaci]